METTKLAGNAQYMALQMMRIARRIGLQTGADELRIPEDTDALIAQASSGHFQSDVMWRLNKLMLRLEVLEQEERDRANEAYQQAHNLCLNESDGVGAV